MSYIVGDLTDPFVINECAFDHPIKKFNADVQLLITVSEEFNVADLLCIYCIPNHNVLQEKRIKSYNALGYAFDRQKIYNSRQSQIDDDVKKYETLVNAVAQGNIITCSYDDEPPF